MTETLAAGPRRRASARVLAQGLRRRAECPAASRFGAPLAVLLARHLRFDAADPLWPDRDRLLATSDAAGLLQDAGKLLGGSAARGFHTAAEPVGAAAGVALAERMLAGRFGRSLVDHRCWVLADAGQLATGQVQEAACLAGLWRLGRLTVIACLSSEAEAAPPAGTAGFAAYGWTVRRVSEGHTPGLDAAISAALRSFKPTLILYAPAEAQDAPEATETEAEESWRLAGQRGAGARRAWLKRLARNAGRAELEAALAGRHVAAWPGPLATPAWLPACGQPFSTAQTLRLALADMTASLQTFGMVPGDPSWPHSPSLAEFAGRGGGALSLGGASALAGLALHGGVLPSIALPSASLHHLCPTLGWLAAARLRALAIVVETPPSSGAALAALRATPNLLVLRPADATEALECLEHALRHASGPSVMLVSEQPVPAPGERPARTRTARGGYVVAGAPGPRAATLLASGPELQVALAARARLQSSGLAVSVVSMPCWALLAAQDAGARAQLLGTSPLIGLEASNGHGWERWLGQGMFISLLPEAGAPAPSPETQAEHVALAVARHLRGLAGAPLP